ncbi:MAG: ABC transporter permease [Alphaproteobacteria bacterium]|nr:ABC transporter permease [Alphaproteobacteria bacterium]
MSVSENISTIETPKKGKIKTFFSLLWSDQFAFFAAVFLILVLTSVIFGPMLLDYDAGRQNLRGRNAAPFDFTRGWMWFLGGDQLGRPLLARVLVAAQNTIFVAGGAVMISMTIGSVLGVIAGNSRGRLGQFIPRIADVIMSFPSLLLAVIVLYMLEPSVSNIIIVLAITRIPVYLRTARAEILEIRERMFIQAAIVMGASKFRIIFRHMMPMLLPTLLTVATLDFAFVMLAESSLSFLGIGIQPPDITWGLMVSQGRPYLTTAWWLSFWPGLAIIFTTLSLNLISNWIRIALDPQQRWRLEIESKKND